MYPFTHQLQWLEYSFREVFSKIVESYTTIVTGILVLCCTSLGVVVNVNESLSNGLFLLTVCFMLALLSESIELPASTLYTNIMIGLSLTHELLLCIFTEFSTGSVLIFIVLGMLMDRVMLEKDTQTMAVLFGCFVGVHAVGWTLSGEPFANTAFEIDEIVENWIKFISAPILGVLLFYAARFSLETLNHGEDKILEES